MSDRRFPESRYWLVKQGRGSGHEYVQILQRSRIYTDFDVEVDLRNNYPPHL